MQPQPDNYFNTVQEPERSCLLFLRGFLLSYPASISERWSFNTPFYHCNNKSVCFINYDKKTREIYLSFTHGHKIKHPSLVSEGRKQHKIFRVDANMDIDIKSLEAVMKIAVNL